MSQGDEREAPAAQPGRAVDRKARNKAMVDEWRRGDSVTVIARRHGLSLSWTGVLLRQHGAELPKVGRGIKVHIDEAAVVEAYVIDESTVRAIADDLDVSYGKIYRILQAHDVPMRPRGGRN